MRGPLLVKEYGRAHCLEAAVAVAAALEPHGYPPLLVDLQSRDLLDHTLFVYQSRRKWGAVAKSRDIGLDGRRPVFTTIEQLVRSYAIPYIDERAALFGFGILDLTSLHRNWREAEDIQFIEDSLNANVHTRLPFPSSFVRHWRRRYIHFKKQHPGTRPNYFPDQKLWQ